MLPVDSQEFESYVPVYDAIPDEWENARPFVVEQLKRLANAVNVREIGWFLDQVLLSGKSFIPGVNISSGGGSSQQFRTVLRKVITFPGLTGGVVPNSQPHGIDIDANFSLIQLVGSATNAISLTGEPIPNGADTINYDATNINITVAASYTRAWAIIEYIQEL
jgi:hypothetical protein